MHWKQYLPTFDLRQQQTNNIVFITFWSQFSVYVINTILILFLTRPILAQGLGYNQAKAYAFMGITSAMGYLMPILGGYMADNVVGVRRSILIGSILVALSYLLVMLSGYTLGFLGDQLFIASFALLPATNSLLMGTTSGMISHIFATVKDFLWLRFSSLYCSPCFFNGLFEPATWIVVLLGTRKPFESAPIPGLTRSSKRELRYPLQSRTNFSALKRLKSEPGR